MLLNTLNIVCQARERILPYDVMGTWLNETHFLSAVACERTFQFVTEVVLHKSAQVSICLTYIYFSSFTRCVGTIFYTSERLRYSLE